MLDEVVTDLCGDDDLIALGRECLGDIFFAEAIAVGIRGIEESDAEVEGLVHEGKRLAFGAVGSILSNRPTVDVGVAENDIEKLRVLLMSSGLVQNLTRSGTRLTMELVEGHGTEELNRLASDNGVTLSHLVSKARSLEVEFLEITRE